MFRPEGLKGICDSGCWYLYYGANVTENITLLRVVVVHYSKPKGEPVSEERSTSPESSVRERHIVTFCVVVPRSGPAGTSKKPTPKEHRELEGGYYAKPFGRSEHRARNADERIY